MNSKTMVIKVVLMLVRNVVLRFGLITRMKIIFVSSQNVKIRKVRICKMLKCQLTLENEVESDLRSGRGSPL